QLIRNGRSASLQRTFKKSFTSFSHSTRNKTRDGLIRVRNIRALNGRFNTSITHAYSIVIGSKQDRKSGSAGMPRPISYAVFCLKKKKNTRTIESSATRSLFCLHNPFFSFFSNHPPPTEIYTLSLHDALPI